MTEPIRFTCVVNFFSDETRSQYCAGLSYTARAEDELLRSLLQRWNDEGKIIFGGGAAIVTGKGQ